MSKKAELMSSRAENGFDGFPAQTVEFLTSVRANNNKPWFEAHRGEYERYLLSPMRALVEELATTILMIDPLLEISPRIDKTISRIHRDVRFSKDKSPYRTTLWIAFKHNRKDWQDTPGFFMEFSAIKYRYGMGFYSASKRTMDRLRDMIDREPQAFIETVAFIDSGPFELEGETYKRVLNPSKTGVLLDWYQRRNCYVVRNRKTDRLFFSRKLADELSGAFRTMKPLYDFLWKAKQ